MNLRMKFAGMVLAGAVLTACSASASTTSLEEYEAMSPQESGAVVQKAVNRIIDYYSEEQPDDAKVTCIMNLFTSDDDRPSRGANLLIREFNKARRSATPERYHIEGLVLGVVNRECPTTQP